MSETEGDRPASDLVPPAETSSAPASDASPSAAPEAPQEAKPAESPAASPAESPAETARAPRPPRPERAERPKKRKRKSQPAGEGRGRSSPQDMLREGLERFAGAYLGIRERTGWRGERESHVEFSFRVPLSRRDLPGAATSLAHEIRRELETRVLAAGLLVPGPAWCFQSANFESEHSKPSDPRQVLVGYGLEGRPRFADIVTLAIERKHEAVDELLAGHEGAVSFVEKGSAIVEGVKPAFDPARAPWQLVAQAMAGLFEGAEPGRRLALTVQVLMQPGADGRNRLASHVVSAQDLQDIPDAEIGRILRGFQEKLDELANTLDGKRAAGEEVDAEEAVLPVVRELTRRLSASTRNKARKTEHARERGSEGQRPTQLAFPEARSARDHHLYMDNEEGTIVVVGKRGRMHVFSPDGRHVTTVVLSPTSFRARVKEGRWRPAEPAERGSFREALAAKPDDAASAS